MKKFLSIISIILVLSLFSATPAFAAGSWETEPIDISEDSQTTDSISISKCSVSNIKSKTYTGDVVHQSPVVKYGKTTLKKGTDYTLSYKKNVKVGTATMIIKGKGIYTGSVTKTFKINPKGTSVSKVTSPKTKQIKVTWKKQKTQTTGYQIQLATNSSFTNNKKLVTVSKNTSTVKTVKSLKKNKKYYVRIRTYKTVDGKKYYSSWSKAKTVKTK